MLSDFKVMLGPCTQDASMQGYDNKSINKMKKIIETQEYILFVFCFHFFMKLPMHSHFLILEVNSRFRL